MSVDGNSIIIQDEEDGQVREQLMEELKSIYKNGRRIKRRNEVLKRCLREFFKKRKLDHMCKEQELSSAEIEAAYESKLDNYARVCAANEAQLRVKCEEQTRLDEACERMQLVWTQRLEMLKQAELQTGGRWLDEMKKDKRDGLMKRLTKLIETQSECYSTEGKARLAEIKLREKIRASEAELKLVDNVDGDIQACDYERVRAESERIQTNIDEKLSQLKRIETNNAKLKSNIEQLKQKNATLQSRSENVTTNLETVHERLEKMSLEYRQTVHVRDRHSRIASYISDHSELNLHPRLIQDYHEKTARLLSLHEQVAEHEESLHQLKTKIAEIDRATIGQVRSAKSSPKIVTPIGDRFRLDRSRTNYWSRSKSRSSDGSSTIPSSLSFSFNTKKLQLLE